MSSRTLAVLTFLGLLSFVAMSSVAVLDESELAIVTQLGKHKATLDKPGIHFKLPFLQTVHRMERRILGSDAPPAEYLTLDKKRLVADPITRWRIVNPLQFFITLHDENGARARIDDIVLSEMRREVASHNFGEIVGNARDPLMVAVATRAGLKSKKEFGIEIIDVRIKRADLPHEVQESVFARMRAERERIAKQYRSEGEEEAEKIRAETDKEKTILLAKAYEVAQKLRGEGDAISTRIYAETYGKDTELYSFLRSLDAYEQVINDRTSLVLSTQSEMFKYLAKPGKK